MAINDTKVFTDFKDRKALRFDLKELEKELREKGFKGWFSWTLTSRPHVMRLFSKVGAKPYVVKADKDPLKDQIWFMKEV